MREEPTANEGTDNSYDEVADDFDPVPRTICPASHPAIRPTSNMVRSPFARYMHFIFSRVIGQLSMQLHAVSGIAV